MNKNHVQMVMNEIKPLKAVEKSLNMCLILVDIKDLLHKVEFSLNQSGDRWSFTPTFKQDVIMSHRTQSLTSK